MIILGGVLAVNGEDRAEIQEKIAEAAQVLDDNLQALVRRAQRTLRITLLTQGVILICVGLLTSYLLAQHSHLVKDTHQLIASAARDLCPVFYSQGTPDSFPTATQRSITSVEAYRKLYITRGCPPSLPPPSPALRAKAAQFGIKLIY